MAQQRRKPVARRGSAQGADPDVLPVVPSRWPDLDRLFGPRGGCAGCWCMWWRIARSEWENQKGDGNRRALQRIVRSGEVPGLIAYVDGEPAAWCALAPRDRYPVLERSRTLARVDDQPVWSVVCFFVARPFRGRGLSRKLLRAAVEYAKRRGAPVLEGYPIEPKSARMPDAFAWTGFASVFRQEAFQEVLRRSPTRPIMRRELGAPTRRPAERAGRGARGRGELTSRRRPREVDR